MRHRWFTAVAVAVAAGTALAAGGCSSASPSSSAGQQTSGAPVTIGYWGWVPDMQSVVATWNKEHPDIKVNYTEIASSSATTKFQTAVQAGNAPCLGQVSYDDLLSYVAGGLLQNVTSEAKQYQSNYLPWTWAQVSPQGVTYGIPQDTGPVVMYYRADLFKKYGITPPATWAEYAADAVKVHKEDPSVVLGTLSPDDADMFQALTWQNNAVWWSVKGDSWVVSINDSESQAVAGYWQQLIDEGAVTIADRWAPTFYQDMNDGKVIAYIGAAWNASLIQQNVKGGAGDWRVVQMPVWAASNPESANSGGSSVAVLKGCKAPAAALEFANWLDNSEQSMSVLASPTGGGLYPASTAAQKYPVVNSDVPFYGNENIYQQFKASAALVSTDWDWGPVQDQVYNAVGDAISSVANKQTTLPAALGTIQSGAISDAKAKGISVEEAG
jgi:multiple sugar transport system substrate-binding protein